MLGVGQASISLWGNEQARIWVFLPPPGVELCWGKTPVWRRWAGEGRGSSSHCLWHQGAVLGAPLLCHRKGPACSQAAPQFLQPRTEGTLL